LNSALAAGVSAAAVMGLTVAHHAYGAARFDTPWRLHVVHLSLWVTAAIAICVVIHLGAPGRIVRRSGLLVACMLTLLVPVGWIGVFEGGYSHVLKNMLYFAGLSYDTFQRLFPPPRYVVPSDWIFELTGVLQFPLGLLAAGRALRWWRT
jgi:hypothetical protein